VMCNREVKFGAFYSWAKAQGADYVATGHYAKHDGVSLVKSEDENKDQTYFLWTLSKNILPSVIFPVGDIEKSQVRVLAEKFKLPVATKKDSQGLCFVGTIDVKTLLKNYIEEKSGDVLNENGEVIGNHEGVMFYTIGERHGFNITKKSTDDEPYFVIAKDFDKNTLTVSHVPPQEVKGEVIHLSSCNWTRDLEKGKVYEARARYRAPLAKVESIDGSHFKVISGELVATPGQSLVLYNGEICVGGGIII
jgi:tRNA-uridine 2-sulfurtransferase